MIELIFATNNQHKVAEIQSAIGDAVLVTSLAKAGIIIEIPEPFNTLEENASEKSKTIAILTGKNCFSEDTGLEVEALNGDPGVKSARYADEDKLFNTNIDKLLFLMKGVTNRSARFRTIISLRFNDSEFMFEGVCEGKIGYLPLGDAGFGYDGIFIPFDSYKTFAEMTIEQKACYSHRKKAADKLVAYLQYSLNDHAHSNIKKWTL